MSTAEAHRCYRCNGWAVCACSRCATEFHADNMYLCAVCDKQVHAYPNTANHVRNHIESSLDLLSVICIETRHCVCFARQPSNYSNEPPRWIFLDSMASHDRVCKLIKSVPVDY